MYQLKSMPDDTVYLHLSGTISFEENKKFLAELLTMLNERAEKNGPANVLVELSLTYMEPNLIALNATAAKDFTFKKAAGYGLNSLSRGILEAIVQRAGAQDRVRLFDSRKDAEAWLQTD